MVDRKTRKPAIPKQTLFDLWAEASRETNQYALSALANLLLLNGGGVLAVGPISSLFGVGFESSKLLLVIIIAFFVLGLVSTAIGYTFGYFANSNLALMYQKRLLKRPDEEVEGLKKSYNRIRFFGVAAAIMGLTFFILGSVTGTYSILSLQVKELKAQACDTSCKSSL
jgi:hypothetical protein